MKRIDIWSSGGGTQSAAIAALICMGELSPDISIISDTERECEKTWNYHENIIVPALESAGHIIHRIKKSDYATVDIYRGDKLLIPAFTDESGDIGKLPTFCSTEWKKRVVQRFATTQFPEKTQFNMWIGYSTDELKRVYQELGKWQPRYPLIEKRISRGDCYRLVEKMGWPPPPRSRCWMCPNQTHADWMELHKEHERAKQSGKNYPTDWEKAVEFEKEIRAKDDAVYLHRSGKPLSEVKPEDDIGDLFTGRCDSGMCFV